MKLKIFSFIFMISTVAFSQSKPVKVNHQNFEFKTLKTDDFSRQTIEIFRDNAKILMHTLYNEDGNCSNIQIEIGNYEIKNNQIIFYTYWAAADLQGLLSYPFGFRKQTYSVNDEGKLKLVNSKIYIEDNINDTKYKTLFPLKSNLKTKAKKELKAQYIKEIEEKYNAHFVEGKEKITLQNEVIKIIEKEIQTATKDWEKTYAYSTVTQHLFHS